MLTLFSSRDDIISELQERDFVQQDGQYLSLHRLIQVEFCNTLSGGERNAAFLAAASVLNAAFPKQVNGGSLRNEAEQCKNHIQHVLILCAQWQTYKFGSDCKGQLGPFTQLLTNAGWYAENLQSAVQGG